MKEYTPKQIKELKANPYTLNDDCQMKLIDTMQKVVNETSNGIICLIL